jgi:HEAT repeat protein
MKCPKLLKVLPIILLATIQIPAKIEVASALGVSQDVNQVAKVRNLLDQWNGPTRGEEDPDREKLAEQLKPSSIPIIISLLKDRDAKIRSNAAHLLSYLGWSAKSESKVGSSQLKSAIPALIILLKDPNKSVQIGSLEALGEIGSSEKLIIENLLKFMLEPDSDLSRAGARAMKNMDSKAYMPSMLSLLKNPDRDKRMIAIDFLERQDLLILELNEILKSSPDKDIRAQAVYQLGEMGDLAKSSVPLIEPLLREENNIILEGFAKMGAPAVPALIQVIEDESYSLYFRRSTVMYLGDMGEPAKVAIPSLVRLLRSQDADLRSNVETALKRLDYNP